MAEKVVAGDDYAGISNGPEGFIEPTISVSYNVTPDFSIGGMCGVFMITSDSERRYVSGIEVTLKF